MQNLIPSIVIPSDNNYYLYSKVKYKRQNLVKLDQMGYLFFTNMADSNNDEEAINSICDLFSMSSIKQRNQVKHDYDIFKDRIKYAGLFIQEDPNTETKYKEEAFGEISESKYIEEFAALQRSFTARNIPFKYFIELTYDCNLRCSHCYRGEEIDIGGKYLKKEEVFSTLDEMENMGVVEVIFTGGECLIHPDIFEILEYASHKNLIITVLSNGNLIDETCIEKLKKCTLYDVRISIYGMKERHENMTKVKGSWEKSVRAIKLLHDNLGIGTAVYVVTEDNVVDSEEVIRYFESKGIDLAINTVITPTSRGNLDPTQMRISINKYENLMRENSLPITGSNCTAGISRMRITPSGDVIPCELILGHQFGNIYEQTLEEIINGEKRKEFISFYKTLIESHTCSVKCELKGICNFCPAIFFIENGDFNKPVDYVCKMTYVKQRILQERTGA
jgi:radical SAM protein with 4Fe4S-binding SPASM domain